MRRIPKCNIASLEDLFNFGRYRGLSLADVLDINPSYLGWCVKHCTGVIFQLEDSAIRQIRIVYPNFIMDNLFESRRLWNLSRNSYDYTDDGDDYCTDNDYDSNAEDSPTYDKYAGSWAQEIEGFSDDDIDTIFDGDPSAYWNID